MRAATRISRFRASGLPGACLRLQRNSWHAPCSATNLSGDPAAKGPLNITEERVMPLSLVTRDVSADLEKVRSVLIVSCPVCPPVSLAVQKNSPLIEFFKSGVKTRAFEDYIKAIREPLEQRGVRTGVLSMYTPFPPMCLWTEGQRNLHHWKPFFRRNQPAPRPGPLPNLSRNLGYSNNSPSIPNRMIG